MIRKNTQADVAPMLKLLVANTFLLACLPAYSATDAQWYGNAHLGRNTLDYWPASVDFGGPTLPAKLDLSKSTQGGLAVGRDFGNWRAELEYQFGRVDIDSATVGNVTQPTGERGSYQTGMLNGYRDIQITRTISAFVGIGVGWAKVKLPEIALGSNCTCFRRASDSDWTYQGRLGLELALTPKDNLQVQVSRLHLAGPEARSTLRPHARYDDRWVTAIEVGYRRMF